MYILNGKSMSYALNEKAHNVSVVSNLTGHETMCLPGHIWKMIYAIPGTETPEMLIGHANCYKMPRGLNLNLPARTGTIWKMK